MKPIKRYFKITVCVIVTLLSVSKIGNAQSSSRNSGLDQTTFDIIKTRTQILENFKKNDFANVKSERDSLKKEFETDNHLPFFPAEYWLLCFWTKDYTNILNDKFVTDTNQYNNTYISYPIFDTMGEEIRKATSSNLESLKTQIASSNLNTTDKTLLITMLFYSIHRNNETKDTLQLSLNEMARTYINNNPKSSSVGMLQKYVIKEYIGLKGADEIIFGGGYTSPIGNLSKKLMPGYNLSIDYRRYFGEAFVDFTANIYTGKFKDSTIVNSKMMHKDELFNHYYLGLDLGARIVDTKRISLSAFGGGAYCAMGITHIVDPLKNVSEQVTMNSFAGRVGVTFDFKFIKQGIYADFKKYSDFNHFKFLRLKYDYQVPMYKNNATDLTGGLQNITLSIGFDTRDVIKK